jgi:hypothetical protein
MEISKTVELAFHGIDFIVTVTGETDRLTVEAEES